MKRVLISAFVIFACFYCLSDVFGGITVNGPTKHIKFSICPAKDGFNQLNPVNPKQLDPPGNKSGVRKELGDPNADSDFSGWTFQKGAKLNGTLNIDYYCSKFKGTHFSGGQIYMRYKKGAGDPANLRWVQLVNSNKTFNPPAKYPAIDPYPSDDPNKANPDPNELAPFYYNKNEIGAKTGKATFDLSFYDFSSRRHPPTSFVSWDGELYISSWDGQIPGTVTLHDGINWGWIACCINWEDIFGYIFPWFTNITSPVSGAADKVELRFDGAHDSIVDEIDNHGGSVDLNEPNVIKITWDSPLEPNTPVSIKFITGYPNLTFNSGDWFLDAANAGFIDPCSITVTRVDSGVDNYNVKMTDSELSDGASWVSNGTGYNEGQWFRYPNTGWWNVWLDNGPYDANGYKKINTSMVVRRIDPNNPANATIVLGYSTDIWSELTNDYPPRPEDVPTLEFENNFIYRNVGDPGFDGPVDGNVPIEFSLTAGNYNPEWTSVCVKGENIEVGYGRVNYDDPEPAPLQQCDVECDGLIDFYDIRIISGEWLAEGSKYVSDRNDDGVVNLRDFATFANNWLKSE